MNNTRKEIPYVTLPLTTQIDLILRDDHYIPIDRDTAEIIHALCKNKYVAYVQFPEDTNAVDILGRPLETPILWRLNAFRESTERWMRARKNAEIEREKWHVFYANVRAVVKVVMEFTGVDEKFAQPVAEKLVKNNHEKKVVAMGGKPFYKSLADLP